MSESCANPLLLQWLKEWMDEAEQRNSKGFTVYRKAYQSMKACPLKFNHPSEAQQLNGLGPKLCDRLADKLNKYCTENGLPIPERINSQKKRAENEANENGPAQKKVRKSAPYVPKLRSGPYALLMALSTLDQEGSQTLSKGDLIELAQPLCDSSFTAPSDPTKFFTAWNSMKTLENKELVCVRGHPTKRYYLSDEGWEVALRIRAVEKDGISSKTQTKLASSGNAVGSLPGPAPKLTNVQPVNTEIDQIFELSSDIEADTEPRPPTFRHVVTLEPQPGIHSVNTLKFDVLTDTITVPAECVEIRLVLDTREIRTKTDRDYISDELKKLGVVPLIQALPLGDVLWIARMKPDFKQRLRQLNAGDDQEGSTDIILDHIMERKRLDDLVGSIKDGRFHEQKFRLRKSGIKHVTYLVEDYSLSSEKSEKYGESIESAIASMQVVNDYFVKRTTKLDDTIQYLARMTRTLVSLYSRRPINLIPSKQFADETYMPMLDRLRLKYPENIFGMTFSTFSSICDKSDSLTLRDVFLKMLMSVRGVTGDRAIEIQKAWPTPQALIEAYEKQIGMKERENMISDRLGNAIPRKKVGRALSSKIAEIWAA